MILEGRSLQLTKGEDQREGPIDILQASERFCRLTLRMRGYGAKGLKVKWKECRQGNSCEEQ
jgi:hypothetical protein